MEPLNQVSPAPGSLYKTEVLSSHTLAPHTLEIKLVRPAGFCFESGQWIRLKDQNLERDYSLTNSTDSPALSICVRLIRGGAFSSRLSQAAPGSEFFFTGPHGYFVYRPSVRPAVWGATGTGIAPFVSMCRSGIQGFILLHGVRSRDELYYVDLFRKAARQYVPCLSGKSSTESGVFSGKITRFLETRLAPGMYDFYLCGRREMIRDATLVIDERFPASRIYSEMFF